MKFLVVAVATMACAFAAPNGYPGYAPYGYPGAAPAGPVADTPEVAQAKAAHLAEHAKRGNYVGAPGPAYGYAPAHAAAPADIKVLPSGFLADTPEVAHAKAAHLAEKAKVAPAPYAAPYAAPAYAPAPYSAYPAPAPYAAPYAGSYAHAPAPIKVLPSGFLADTPEVAQAKAAHAAETAKSAAAAAASPDHGSYDGHYAAPAPAPYAGHYAAPAPAPYAGHYAAPVVSASGFLADTPEVAQAKAAHLALKSAASHSHY